MLNYDGVHYLCVKEIASRYELSVHWFKSCRYNKIGPKYYKLTGRIYYTISDVDEWMKQHLRSVTANQKGQA